ncbi:hypothetical protein DIPPA_33907 [Diplonema papillatum]|nr:hypothetical protein DIPPA_33907 [Diplonema papillatum]
MSLAPQARVCRLCGTAEADRYGDHSLTCLSAGLRTRVHTAQRNEVAAVAMTTRTHTGRWGEALGLLRRPVPPREPPRI